MNTRERTSTSRACNSARVPHPRAHAAAVAGLRRASGVARAGAGRRRAWRPRRAGLPAAPPGYGPAGRGRGAAGALLAGLVRCARCASSTSCGVRCVPTKVPTRGKEVHLRPRARAGRSAGRPNGRGRAWRGGRAPPAGGTRITTPRSAISARPQKFRTRFELFTGADSVLQSITASTETLV